MHPLGVWLQKNNHSRCACARVACAHASPLRLKQGNQQREKRDRQRSLCSACAPASWGKSPVTRMQKLSTAQEGIHKAPCAWRTPPPSRGKVPILPVCKSYQRRKKRPAVYPPPSGAGPAITRMQKLSAVHKATPVAKWCRL